MLQLLTAFLMFVFCAVVGVVVWTLCELAGLGDGAAATCGLTLAALLWTWLVGSWDGFWGEDEP